MQRQRGELVPIGDALSGLGGPMKAIREASPQAVHQLVSAGEADADLGFMARLMALCSLPRTNPGNRLQYKRTNGSARERVDQPAELMLILSGGHLLYRYLRLRPYNWP